MTVAPTFKIYEVTGIGTGLIAAMNTGGVTAIHVGEGAASPYHQSDFGAIMAGTWSAAPDNPPPKCYLFQFTGNSAQTIGFGLYDFIADNTGVNFFDGEESDQYAFRLKVTSAYVNPSTFTSAAIESGDAAGWTTFPHGTSRITLDTIAPNPGNDGTANLLVGHNSNSGTLATPGLTDRFFTNFFLYLAVKPGATAAAGEHLNWGPRVTYVYPTV
jgi:hypothetical protein